MESLIWQVSSVDGADHGQSCAAFASLTLALGAQAAGQQSWVTGGGSYPWPLHRWADVRVQPNPASPDVVSMLADAQAHHRWHPLGDGYRPQPGDWVLFDGHVEVVTRFAGAALYTVGGDSLPDLTVNAHRFPAPFGAAGVLGFVNNGDLVRAADRPAGAAGVAGCGRFAGAGVTRRSRECSRTRRATRPAGARHDPAYRRHDQQPAGVPGTAAQQAFISLVAPGAIAAQQRYGIPAAVTIAQAIDESGWGRSVLATADHNLFGIKGTGPAGRDMLPTREHENGVWVTRTAPFRVYHNVAESIEDHGRLLATDPAYRHAMASRGLPDAFATALTGVYATDPGYGASLIALMRLYNLYRYDAATPPAASSPDAPAGPARRARPPSLGSRASRPWCRVSLTRRDRPGRDGIPGVAGALAVGAVRARPARSGRRAERPARSGPGGEPPAEAGSGRGRGSRRGVRCRRRAATSRGFRTRSSPTSWRRPRDR